MIRYFPFAFILSGYAAWKIAVPDVLHHRFMTMMLTFVVGLCGGTAAWSVWIILGFAQSVVPLPIGDAWIGAMMAIAFAVFSGWAAFYLKAKNPMMSTLLWGGELNIVQYNDAEITVTPREAAMDPNRVFMIVEARIPGIFFFEKPTLRVVTGQTCHPVQWTFEAIEEALMTGEGCESTP